MKIDDLPKNMRLEALHKVSQATKYIRRKCPCCKESRSLSVVVYYDEAWGFSAASLKYYIVCSRCGATSTKFPTQKMLTFEAEISYALDQMYLATIMGHKWKICVSTLRSLEKRRVCPICGSKIKISLGGADVGRYGRIRSECKHCAADGFSKPVRIPCGQGRLNDAWQEAYSDMRNTKLRLLQRLRGEYSGRT